MLTPDRLKKNSLLFSLIVASVLGHSTRCEASLFSSFVKHVTGQAKAVIRNPVQAIAKGINHEIKKAKEDLSKVTQTVKEAGEALKDGQIGKGLGKVAEAAVNTLVITSKVLGPEGEFVEGGVVAVVSSTLKDAAKDAAINAALSKLPDDKREKVEKIKDAAEVARTAKELALK